MKFFNLILKNLLTFDELCQFGKLEFSTDKSDFIFEISKNYIIRVNQKLYHFDNKQNIYFDREYK